MVDAPMHPVTNEDELDRHVETYRNFQLGLRWIIVTHVALIPFLVLLFCTRAGFLGSLFVGVVILAIGVFWLTHRRPEDEWPILPD